MQNGQPISQGVESIQLKSNLDLRVVAGTELPLRKAKKKADARYLFEAGVIDEEQLLEAHEWPNKEKVLAKLAQKRDAEAQAMMAQQMMEQGGVPPAMGQQPEALPPGMV